MIHDENLLQFVGLTGYLQVFVSCFALIAVFVVLSPQDPRCLYVRESCLDTLLLL